MARTLICKLLQRKTYDILTRKYTIVFLFVGLVVIIVSVLQFGEALLSWSTEKYGAMFYPFSDNIAGKSFHKMLCQHVPIDVVYTWVNGSDPKHLEGLARAKEDYGFTQTYTNSCSLGLCIESHLVLLKPSLPNIITLSDLEEAEPLFEKVTDSFSVSSPFSSQVNATVLVFPSIDDAKRASGNTFVLVDGKNYSIFPGYVSDNWASQDTVPLKNTYIVLNTPLGISEQDLIDQLPPAIKKEVKKIYLHKDVEAAILTVTSDESVITLNKTNKLADKNALSISAANLVVEFASDHEDISASRFTDNEELRYSLRSLEKHAPWVQHIYIVTNGQIPSWLNLDNPRITVITHEEIFPNTSHLPTFSSPAIECHLHKIPNLSKKFLYLNDDVLFGKDVWPEDFYTHTKGQKVYLSWPVPNCAEGCPSSWIRDGYCDKPCNNSMCQWDGGDCTSENPMLPYHGVFGQLSSEASQLASRSLCNEECINTWLADRYCDKACNVRNCGFDLGDCGIENYHEIFQLYLSDEKSEYELPKGETLGFFNISELLSSNFTVKEAFYDDVPIVRSMAVSTKHDVLSFVLHPNHNKTKIKIILRSEAWLQLPDIVFHLIADTKPKPIPVTTKSPSLNVSETKEVYEVITFKSLSDDEKYPKLLIVVDSSPSNYSRVNISVSLLPKELIMQLMNLRNRVVADELTEKGYWKKKANAIDNYMKSHENESAMLVYNNENDFRKENESFSNFTDSSISRRELLQIDEEQQNEKQETTTISFNTTKTDGNTYGLKTKGQHEGGILQYLIVKAARANSTNQNTIQSSDYETPGLQKRQLLDTFGDSLRHANKLYNEAFGYEARKVPSHIAHFIDKDVMSRLYERFYEAFDVTSSHKIRSSNDMQFAFSYYYFLMSEGESVDIGKMFDAFDVDKSGTWSDREIRTVLARVNDLPLDFSVVHEFEQNIINCSKTFKFPKIPLTTPYYERYYDSKLPVVTKALVSACEPVANLLVQNFGEQKKNQFEIVGEEEVAFKMIHNNLSHVLGQIDDIRKHPKKFVCLNDNMKHGTREAEMIRAVIQDFYESFFPRRSQFELPPDYRNRFLYMDELKEWRRMRDIIRLATYLCLGLLIIFSVTSFYTAESRPQTGRRLHNVSNRRRPYQV